MNLLTVLVLVTFLASAIVKAEKKDCETNGGTCISKKKKISAKKCDHLPYKCGKGQTCCGSLDDKVGKETKRKCTKTTKKCFEEGGICVPTRNLNCATFAVDSLCKGASCTCCVSEVDSCKILPACRFRNGFCVHRLFASHCASRNTDSILCGSRNCKCCMREGNCNCGEANKVRIVGGEAVDPPNKYPWMVGLSLPSGKNYFCGGTLINDRYILTAAHCMFEYATGNPLKAKEINVVLGDHNQHSVADDVPGATRTVEIEDIKLHEDYSDSTVDNDIALLKLKEPLDLSVSYAIKPVCLPLNADSTYEGEDGTVAGWGLLDYNYDDILPDKLKEVTVPILSPECKGKDNLPLSVTENMMCAGFKKGGKDSCKGDSGGPFVVKEGSIYTLVGIVSFGNGCAERNTPGVYTRVTRYLDWIMTNTADAKYCS